MIKKTIKLPHIKARVTIILGEWDAPEWFGGEGYMGRTAFRRENGNKLPFHAVIHSRSAAISVVAHEAVHAASFIFDAIGAHADFNNDEFLAYFVQYICEEAENMTGVYGN